MNTASEAAAGVKGEILEDVTVPAGSPWGRKVAKGEHIRFIDVEGKQALDFLCYDAADPSDRYNAGNTMKMAANIFLTKGTVLWSDRGRKMMTILEDTCGFHDTIGGCCSSALSYCVRLCTSFSCMPLRAFSTFVMSSSKAWKYLPSSRNTFPGGSV